MQLGRRLSTEQILDQRGAPITCRAYDCVSSQFAYGLEFETVWKLCFRNARLQEATLAIYITQVSSNRTRPNLYSNTRLVAGIGHVLANDDGLENSASFTNGWHYRGHIDVVMHHRHRA